MDTYDYEYQCPGCKTWFCGEIDTSKNYEALDIVCEDCGKRFLIEVKFIQKVEVTCTHTVSSKQES